MLNKPFLMFTTVLLFFVIVSLPVSLANPIPATSTTDGSDVLYEPTIGKVSRALKLMSRKKAPQTKDSSGSQNIGSSGSSGPNIGNPGSSGSQTINQGQPNQPNIGKPPHKHRDSNERITREDRFEHSLRRRTQQ